jgi:predicted MPP superfamily phosphohydrolase
MPRLLSFSAFLLVALTVLGGMHAYLWLRLVRDPALAEPWRRLATVLLVALTLGIPAGLFALRLSSGWVARFAPIAAATWLGIAFILFCAVAALDLARLAAQGVGFALEWLRLRADPPADPARRIFVARALAGTAVVLGGGTALTALRSATGPAEVSEVPIKLARLPPALSGYTIAQISDLHVGPTIRGRHVRRVVEQANALRPDLVAITGDLVDGSVAELEPIVAELGRLQARHGVVFVTGNHDFYSGAAEWTAVLRRLGFRVLDDARLAVGDGGGAFDLAGTSDYRSAYASAADYEAALQRTLSGRDPDRALVLLQHQPQVGAMAAAARAGVDLQLSGHTHGGQIVPFSLLVATAYPFLKGHHTYRDAEGHAAQVYVSRGTGYWGPPFRLGSPPEIAKIVLTT